MKIIALFFPALIALQISKKKEVSVKDNLLNHIFMYCMFVIVTNVSVMAVLSYVLGMSGLTITVFESFSFFIIYTVLSCCGSAFIGGLTKILRKNIEEAVSE